MNRKKIKLSILIRTAILFIVAVVASGYLSSGIVKRIIIKYAVRQGEDLAVTVATAVKTVVGTTGGYDALLEDEAYRDRIHNVCRYICESCTVQNLYIYSIDENERKHYIVIASSDDEDDRKMNEEYGFGSPSTRPIYQAEKDILNGNIEGGHEFVENDYGGVYMYVIPVIGDDGNIICFIGEDFSLRRILDISEQDARMIYMIRVLFVSLIFIFSLILMRQVVIKPIQNLSIEMRNYVKDRENSRERRKRRRYFEDEISDIEDSFDEMTADISGYLSDIEQLTKDRVQNQTQLDIARKIQCGIVPEEYILPGDGYDIYGFEKPARSVGGDFYDVFEIDPEKVCIIVGDISGKGISAALFMVMVKTELREKLKAGRGLADALMDVNRDICMANPENMFATVFVSVLDSKTGHLTYANAGHNQPLILCGEPYFLPVKTGTAMGLFDDIEIYEEEIQLRSGEGILIYTDGITEAINVDKCLFGEERLKTSVKDAYTAMGKDCSAVKLVKSVISAVSDHSGEEEQFDDITCTAAFFWKKDEMMTELKPDLESFSVIKNEILGALGNSDCTRTIIMVCEEIYANIVSYSGADEVSYSISRAGDTYSVTFLDNGIPFDPVNSELPDKEIDELDTGGMGIKLARLYSREMIYQRADDRNRLTMKFGLQGDPERPPE